MNIFGTNAINLYNVKVHQYKTNMVDRIQTARNHHGISFRFNGYSRFLCEDYEPMDAYSGTIMFIPEGLEYTHQSIKPSDIIAIHFNANELHNCPPFMLNPLDSRNFKHLFNQLYYAWNENPEPSNVSVMAITYKILELIINDGDAQLLGIGSRILLKAIKYMHQKFSSSDLTVNECAEAAGISEIYLRKLFKEKMKTSPSKYLCDFRIANAKNLLSSGYYSIMETAVRSGFSCPSYFCKIFKKYTGVSPLVYGRQLLFIV